MTPPSKATFQPRMHRKPPFTVEATGYKPVEGETIPRRHPKVADGLRSRPEEGVTTLYELLKRSSEKYGNAKCMGFRSLIKTHRETKMVKKTVDGQEREVPKEWTYFELSGYKYISYIEFERLALQVGAALRRLGLVAGDRAHVFASSR